MATDTNSLRVTRRWDVYAWAVIAVLCLIFIIAAIIGLDTLMAIVIVPAAVLFVIVIAPYIVRGRP